MSQSSDLYNKKYVETVIEEKKRFLQGKAFATNIVPQHIRESWKRSLDAGVSPDTPSPHKVSSGELQKNLLRFRQLLDIARPIMEECFSTLPMESFSISLVSDTGILLQMYHNLPNYSQFAQPGQIITEKSRGTGAMTLAISSKKPEECFSAEHFCRYFENIYSSACPIYNSLGEVIAFISMSTVDPEYLYHLRILNRNIVSSIATQLHLCLLLEENIALINGIEDAVILLDEKTRVVRINKKASSLLRLSEIMDGRNLFDVIKKNAVLESIESSLEFQNLEIRIQTYDGEVFPCVASFKTFGNNKGGILYLKDVKQMHEYAARVTGNRAVYSFDDIIGTSPKRRTMIRTAIRAAQNSIPVLIQGESGTGKELLAHSLHNAGSRRNKPFIAVNCGAFPIELVQSELFGYSTGAFTGAKSGGNPGKFELAEGGTLFLDEIGEMPLNAQVSLLRVLQSGEFTRIGGTTVRRVDVRIVAATNRDLKELVQKKLFRKDLLYRLNAITLFMPPLRECLEDIVTLANHFLMRSAKKDNAVLNRFFSSDVLNLFKKYEWPGNVRELENLVEYAYYMAKDKEIHLSDLPPFFLESVENNSVKNKSSGEFPSECDKPDESKSLLPDEKMSIISLLREYGGNISVAAKAIGVSRGLLYKKMNDYGLHASDYKACKFAHKNNTGEKNNPIEQLEKILTQNRLEKLEKLLNIL